MIGPIPIRHPASTYARASPPPRAHIPVRGYACRSTSPRRFDPWGHRSTGCQWVGSSPDARRRICSIHMPEAPRQCARSLIELMLRIVDALSKVSRLFLGDLTFPDKCDSHSLLFHIDIPPFNRSRTIIPVSPAICRACHRGSTDERSVCHPSVAPDHRNCDVHCERFFMDRWKASSNYPSPW